MRRVTSARLAPFGLALDGELIAHLPSDGVIVATPTGSTAYFLSAGGPIIHPSVDALGVAGLMPHTLFARPLIVPSSATIEITCDGELTNANLENDGFVARDLHAGDSVIVRKRGAARALRARALARVLRPPRRQAPMGRADQVAVTGTALLRLTIENVGLIARAELAFADGLTVVTGETGSGKTMLLGGLGARARRAASSATPCAAARNARASCSRSRPTTRCARGSPRRGSRWRTTTT